MLHMLVLKYSRVYWLRADGNVARTCNIPNEFCIRNVEHRIWNTGHVNIVIGGDPICSAWRCPHLFVHCGSLYKLHNCVGHLAYMVNPGCGGCSLYVYDEDIRDWVPVKHDSTIREPFQHMLARRNATTGNYEGYLVSIDGNRYNYTEVQQHGFNIFYDGQTVYSNTILGSLSYNWLIVKQMKPRSAYRVCEYATIGSFKFDADKHIRKVVGSVVRICDINRDRMVILGKKGEFAILVVFNVWTRCVLYVGDIQAEYQYDPLVCFLSENVIGLAYITYDPIMFNMINIADGTQYRPS